ncbi:SDR family NAD(P)-dependent oxidoreductase [Corynebacterium sp. UBA2622]|uniref:SDR family NAD(P)-dependent oxidoreductase n=1 Tax=Corynebacterium sp. UBA2622 TaxID=1946393 RepID=UPI0025C08309|nr:glucose 1-dehydrogenase [Corynebacterium sp. UBA2622]
MNPMNADKEFDGRVALVTAGGAGIGRAIAVQLAEKGARVVVSDVNDGTGRETVELIERDGGAAAYVHADVSEPEDVRNLVPFSLERFGHLDLAVNNAGVGAMPSDIADVERTAWDRAIDITLTGTFLCMQEQLRHFRGQGAGAIVNIASLAGISATPTLTPYGASKHGVVSLTRSAALEYAERGIRINAVAPGAIETAALASLPEDARRGYEQQIPMKRLGRVEDIANATSFLLSERASFITGVVLRVDGGTEA